MQQLAYNYNLTIIRVYDAAGYGKSLVDSMSSFVTSFFRKYITGNDVWFSTSEEICDFLILREDNRMR